MCSDGNDESVFKLKKEHIDTYDKINNRIDNINEVIDIIAKINYKLKNNISYINSKLFHLLLFDEPQLRYKINVKIDDTLNFVWNEIYRKNRKNKKNKISSNEVNIDKLNLLEKMYDSAYDIIREVNSEVNSEMLRIILNKFELYEKDMDKVHSIYSELKKIMIRLKKGLKKIFNQEDLQYK